jgi:hypothetical protein
MPHQCRYLGFVEEISRFDAGSEHYLSGMTFSYIQRVYFSKLMKLIDIFHKLELLAAWDGKREEKLSKRAGRS